MFDDGRSAKTRIVVGWTGTHSTLKYLYDSTETLKRIESQFDNVEFMVIADQRPNLPLKNISFVPWNYDTEIRDLMNFDIGIMPLPDDKWAKGKCGFKALQYMALKVQAIASPVGVNVEIIDHGKNGFLCSTQEEWIAAIATLIRDPSLRRTMGELGRQKVIDRYSLESNSALFLKLFE
jgi:glycosyltransferase involved in cell wall biosynthesis